jgi:hypothetical protein
MLAHLFGGSVVDPRERRQADRQPVNGTGELRACPGDARTPGLAVEMRDFSATGLGIVHDLPLAVGQKFVVKQDQLAADAHRLYTVVRSDSTPDGRYSIGLHATCLLDPNGEMYPRQARRTLRAALAVTASIAFLLALAALMLY